MIGHDRWPNRWTRLRPMRTLAAARSRSVLIVVQGAARVRYSLPEHPDGAQLAQRLAELHRLQELCVLSNAAVEFGDQRRLRPRRRRRPPAPCRRSARRVNLVTRLTKLPSTSARSLFTTPAKCDQVKLRVRALRRIGDQVIAPVIGGQDLQRRVHEHAALAAGRELPAVIVEPVEALQPIDELPRLAEPRMVTGKPTVWNGTLSLPMNST